ncbi:hypothetical protein KR018_000023, partial [Drosophila ironensis]
MNISLMCRICRDESDCQVNIFGPREAGPGQDLEPSLAEMLRECIGCSVSPSDRMPQFVCVECATATRSAYRLRRRCLESLSYFTQALRVREDLDHDVNELQDFDSYIKTEVQSQMLAAGDLGPPETGEALYVELVPSTPTSTSTSTATSTSTSMAETPKKEPQPQKNTARKRSYMSSTEESSPSPSPNNATRGSNKYLPCSECDRSFAHQVLLNAHMRVHSGERPFKCTYCDRAFSQKGNLQTHQRLHTGERPYKCPHCPREFGQNGNLTAHIRTHTGERPFQCKYCNKAFNVKVLLQKHTAQHT